MLGINASTIYSVLGNNSSLIPLGIKDVANSCGMTTASYLAGDTVEGKDRFFDEFGTMAIWLGGIPVYKYIIDKTMYKFRNMDPKIDVRIFKNKDILQAARELAPTEAIQNAIEKAANNQKSFKGMSLAKFGLSTILTMVSYFGLTKFRHKYTENQIKKDFLAKQNSQKYNQSVPFSAAFSDVHKPKQATFTGGLQDFIFDPVKNLMIVDGVITGERFAHSRNAQDVMGYGIKEGSFWLFMYWAGSLISKALEKHTEKKYHKSIDLDARVIESSELKEAFKNGSLKQHIEAFKNADKSDLDIYKYAVTQKDNLVVQMAKKSDIITLFEKTDKVDTRAYIDLGNKEADNFDGLRGVGKKLEKLLNQYEKSGDDIDTFMKAVRKLKRSSVWINMGACIGALGVLAPAIMLLMRKFGDNSEYQVKKDIEAKLQANA
ncbi:hypothetical protein IJ596_08110 [bacterium]|nr:hypothetical protein [bacterium]